MRLIDADKAIMAIEQHRIAVLEGHKWDEGIEYGYAAAHRHIVDIVEQLPSAQPDIIRCKDCKWYGRADKRRFYRGMDCLQKRIDTIMPDRDFCSRAERRK